MTAKTFSLRLSRYQAGQLDYLTALYGNQATAFRVAIDVLYTLRRLEDLGIYDSPDAEEIRAALKAAVNAALPPTS